ncbi:hypothetical protein [Clostridium bowmanii]|nr:hypothetical protein [Clostridium bowmanii]
MEIGLVGEGRPIAQCDKIFSEASKLGLKILLYLREIQRDY